MDSITLKLNDPENGHPTDYTIIFDLGLLEKIEDATGEPILLSLLGTLSIDELGETFRDTGGTSVILKSIKILTIRLVLSACFECEVDDVQTVCGKRGMGEVYFELLPKLYMAAQSVFVGEVLQGEELADGSDPTNGSASTASAPS